jgi:DivIVA domain-containing protein
MDLTSQAINEAEFSMARRGYDPDQVDEFLEKLAVAVDKQTEALAEARERASMAERRAAEAERKANERPERVVDVPAGRDDAARATEIAAAAEAELETLKRTLVLATKTADATVRDAQDEARRMIAAAEEEARAAHEGTRAQLLEEIGKLDGDRGALRADIDALEGHIDQQRARLRNAISDLQRLLDEPDLLHETPAPSLSGVTAASPTPDSIDDSEDEPEVEPSRSATPGVPFTSSTPAESADRPTDDDESWARFAPEDEGDRDAGPPTQPVLRLDEIERQGRQSTPEGEDAYLAELRKAMLDDTGAPGISEAYGSDTAARARFGRRR